MKRIIFKLSFLLLLVAFSEATLAQCFPTQPKTAAFATGGTSKNKNQVLWLTWGSTLANVTTYPYGRHNQALANNSASYASIDVGGGRFLCVKAVISGIVGSDIRSYAPGNYSGDSMDDMYNIGGTGTNNQLVNGIRNGTDGGLSTFTVTCTATLDGIPVKLAGMVIGDAESLAASEYFNATADGKWNIVELQKNLANTNPYQVRKVNVTGTTQQRMEFVKGNDDNTAAVSFLTFNQTAYAANTFDVSFSVTLKGGGLTAIALGLLPPGVDGGDAPASYGSPLHMIDALAISSDGISATIATGTPTNLNTSSYTPGALIPPTSDYLGSVGPDMDPGSLFSKDAMGDNNNGSAGVNEEDAWPAKYKSFSYKANYMPGNIITATIPYKGSEDAYISGWIDFDQNGVFDDSERVTVAAPANQTSVNLVWTVPYSRVIRSTYVRLRYGKNQSDLLSPTSATPGGEVEDHKIFIQGPAITNPMLPSKAKKK
ncbi:CshA/CshB family fibrillar adhesin-related protein [Pedobacter nototheniae]|uniref:CshA/CshB family fibrillar adhesin-related protein n=1 Tax=Pedobacter nototheniae TaxID=2488994 RepID=UPI00103984DE|nr:CshA/CshB family fibrillar adhesin-related protein [Pedobacter nototheniae]